MIQYMGSRIFFYLQKVQDLTDQFLVIQSRQTKEQTTYAVGVFCFFVIPFSFLLYSKKEK